jgi:hypothetical protein
MKKETVSNSEIHRFAHMGMAAYLPGMQYMIELMQRELDGLRAQVALFQAAEAGGISRNSRRKSGKGQRSGPWANMTAEERSAEMKRRMAVRDKNKAAAAGLNPRDKDHPDHAKWAARMAKIRKAAWNKKTKAEKEAWKTAMAAAKAKRNKTTRKNVPPTSQAAAA